MRCSSPVRARGALRYHSSLNSPTVVRLSRPSGTNEGAAGRREVRKDSGSRRARPPRGSASSGAWSPRVTTARPVARPRASRSIQATE